MVDLRNFAINFTLLNSGVPYVCNVGLNAFAKNAMELTIKAIVITIHDEVQVQALNPIKIAPDRTSTCPACLTTVIDIWKACTNPLRFDSSVFSILLIIGNKATKGPTDMTALTI